MIPCHICGKDASLGWIVGFPPAPDSLKMGLCPEHDHEEKREEVFLQWQAMLTSRIEGSSHSHSGASLLPEQMVTVLFSNGSKLSFLCVNCSPTDHETLRLEEKNGGSTFIPLSQIRGYTVRPLTTRK